MSQRSFLSSSAVMAGGTVVSRLSGFVRNGMLVAAIGNELHGDVFNIANTVPNMLYILLAGGVFNAVLVPQLIRAMNNDRDGGTAYTNRIITLAGVFLAGATALLVVAAPLVMRLFLDSSYYTAACAPQRQAVIVFAMYCLPQVFFYGMFVLIGQVMNSRGSFGPMMWAPIANNVVSVIVLAIYLIAYGSTSTGAYSGSQEFILGFGSTLGIAIQFFVLAKYLPKAGFRYRPRWDFRGAGLGHTLRLGIWTVLFVIVNQIAYTVVVRIASAGTATAGTCNGHTSSGTGFTIYSLAYLLVMVPHSIITVSFATAALPKMSQQAASERYDALGHEVGNTVRLTFALVLPMLALLPIVATDLANITYGYGAGANSADLFVPSLSLFALGQFFFTIHYLMLRGFYALEQNRRVFWIQCVVGVVNIVAAIVLTRGIASSEMSPRLVVAYALSYVAGSFLTTMQLRQQLPTLETMRIVRFGVRLGLATSAATLVAWLALKGLHDVMPGGSKLVALTRLVLVGLVDLVVLVIVAQAMRISEINDLVAGILRRFRPTATTESVPYEQQLVVPDQGGSTMGGFGPGSILGGRYRIEVLLSEVDGAKFWLGVDTTLTRRVAIHTVPTSDPRAAQLVEAARASASVVESHILRVLDCTEEAERTWVVNEWGDGTTLHDLLGHGPLPVERAAWLSLEVAATIAEAHRAGVAHGRLNPESVLITRTGEVKIIGFVVNAALRIEPSRSPYHRDLTPFEADVVDLAAILYAATTARWPGYSPSSVTGPPMDMHGPLRPRQVRAGVPRDLDGLCRRVLREEGFDHSLPIESAHEIYAALSDFVGDPARWAPNSISEVLQSPKEVTLPHPRPSDSWLHTGLIPVIDAVLGPDTTAMREIPPTELEPVPTVPSDGLLRPPPDDHEDTGEVLAGTDRWLFGDAPSRHEVRREFTPRPASQPGARRASASRRTLPPALIWILLIAALVVAFVLGTRG
ncbi:MAG TPA: murein biosynthesis integral membrane protein MurJ [Marmoricola sp.]|nr:murein biosynthesis integral membrane protein MurJ [Marmoricola sp.]